jgi:sugar transferase (PEP-CTERM/EpsH1 system associated)
MVLAWQPPCPALPKDFPCGAHSVKILFVCHHLPYPPARGGKIRPFNMIRRLSAQHEITVASVAHSRQELEAGHDLSKFCHHTEIGLISTRRAWLQMLLSLFSFQPASLGYFYVPQLHHAIQRRLKEEKFDLIFVHCSSAAQYVLDYAHCYRIMDFGDMDSAKWFEYARRRPFPLSPVYLLEGIKLRYYEKKVARAFDECTVVAAGEKKVLDTYRLPVPVTIIPNGVDLQFFTNTQASYDPTSLVFLGKMDYYPNVDAVGYFCHDILPMIQQEVPTARFTIVGRNPSRRVRQLAQLPGVSVTGEVPDVRPYLQSAAVSVAPLRVARGMQNKVLESMAMQVPVVASSRAFEGLDAVAGEHLLVADTPQGFAAHVVALLREPELRQRIAQAGRQRIEACHTWPACLQRLDQLIAPHNEALAKVTRE